MFTSFIETLSAYLTLHVDVLILVLDVVVCPHPCFDRSHLIYCLPKMEEETGTAESWNDPRRSWLWWTYHGDVQVTQRNQRQVSQKSLCFG